MERIVNVRKETYTPVLFNDLQVITRKGLVHNCMKKCNFFCMFLNPNIFFSNLILISSNLLDMFLGKFLLIVKAGSSLSFWCPMLYQIVIFQIGICLFRAQCCCHHHLCSWWQRFVSSIGNIEKAMWVFNCLGRLGWFGQSKIILQTDINFTTKDPCQFPNWYSKNYPNQKKFGLV